MIFAIKGMRFIQGQYRHQTYFSGIRYPGLFLHEPYCVANFDSEDTKRGGFFCRNSNSYIYFSNTGYNPGEQKGIK